MNSRRRHVAVPHRKISINPLDDTDLVPRLSSLVVGGLFTRLLDTQLFSHTEKKFISQMQSVIVRSFLKSRFRRFYNSTHCCLALSAARTTIIYRGETSPF